MAVRLRARRDTAANWTSSNPTLQNGELGYETDTRRLKAGDGSTAWTSLGYVTGVIRDTAANWTSGASTPKAGQLCYETDTGLAKIGDGSTAWASLRYLSAVRRDTAANWTSGGSTPRLGELCFETDSGLMKVGDGSTAWGSLAYVTAQGRSAGTSNSSSITLNSTLTRIGDSVRITNGTNTALAMTIASGTYRLHLIVVTSAGAISDLGYSGRVVTSADSVLTVTPPSGGYVQGHIERIG